MARLRGWHLGDRPGVGVGVGVLRRVGVPRRIGVPRRVLALAGLMLGTIGSCTLPSIKPPSL